MFWGNTKVYIFPPFSLITKVLAKAEQDQRHNNINSSLLEGLTMVPSTFVTPCYKTFAPAQKSETFIHTQNKKDSPNVEGASTDSAL